MSLVRRLGRGALAALPASAILLLGACTSTKQVEAQAPPPPPAAQPVEPTTASPPNTSTASNVSISPEILRACNIPDVDAYFKFDSSRLTSCDLTPLDKLATCFRSGPMAGRSMRLVGHADPRGTSEYNMTLGQARADAVAGYLRGRGLAAPRVATTSRGAMDATGRDETGWAHDRRVDVMLGD